MEWKIIRRQWCDVHLHQATSELLAPHRETVAFRKRIRREPTYQEFNIAGRSCSRLLFGQAQLPGPAKQLG